jgi:hypothetical protein
MYTVVSDYFATGEGRTISVLFTMGYPRRTHPLYDTEKDGKFWAMEAFRERFGSWYAQGAEVHEGIHFDLPCVDFVISEKVRDMLIAGRASMEYSTQFHYNFS